MRYGRIAGLVLLLTATSVTAGSSTTLQWTWLDPTPSADSLELLVQGNGIYVAAGQDGVIYMSPDGTTWSPESSAIGEGGTYQDAVFGGTAFVLAGVDASGASHVTSSSDGVHWTDTTLNLKTDNWGMVLAYGNGAYVVMGSDSTATSSDGVHWAVHALNFTPDTVARSLDCTNTVCISIGSVTGQSVEAILFSTDNGVTWSESELQNESVLDSPIANNGSSFFLFVNDGVSKGIYTTPDGNHWTKNTASGNVPIFGGDGGIYWDGTRFLALGSKTSATGTLQSLYSSTDGIAWTQGGVATAPSSLDSTILIGQHQVVTTGSGYVAAGTGDLQIVQSTDFATWTSLFSGSTGSGTNVTDIIYAGGNYVGVGENSASQLAAVVQSTDGVSWNSVYTGTVQIPLTTVAYGGGVYVAVGLDSFLNSSIWLYSADAANWKTISNPPGLIAGDVVYGNGEFVAFVQDQCSNNCPQVESVTSSDGQTWVKHALPAAFVAADAYLNIGFNGTKFIALGGTSSKNEGTVYTSSDGITWTSGGSYKGPAETIFNRIRAFGAGFGAVGSYEEPCTGDPEQCTAIAIFPVVATSPDGVTWSVSVMSAGDLALGPFPDISYTGHEYLVPRGDSAAVSSDGIHWCELAGFPLAAGASTALFNAGQLMVGGSGILSATPGASGSSFTCKDALSGGVYTGGGGGTTGGGGNGNTGTSGGGGDLDLFILTGLLGLAMLKVRSRRGGGRHSPSGLKEFR